MKRGAGTRRIRNDRCVSLSRPSCQPVPNYVLVTPYFPGTESKRRKEKGMSNVQPITGERRRVTNRSDRKGWRLTGSTVLVDTQARTKAEYIPGEKGRTPYLVTGKARCKFYAFIVHGSRSTVRGPRFTPQFTIAELAAGSTSVCELSSHGGARAGDKPSVAHCSALVSLRN